MASQHLIPFSWFVAPVASDLVADTTINTATLGTTVTAAVASTYGLPTDAVGYFAGVDAAGANRIITLSNASATTRAESRFVVQRTDRVASHTVTVTGVTMRRPNHNASGANLTTITLGIDEWIVLRKISGSAEMEIVAGSAVVGAAAA